jgi:hypothetical protein
MSIEVNHMARESTRNEGSDDQRHWRELARRQIRSGRQMVERLRFGQPRGLLSTDEFRRRAPQWWTGAFAATEPARRPPVVHGSGAVDFSPALGALPELGVMRIPGGYALGSQGWVFTPGRRFLFDVSWYGAHATAALLPRTFARPVQLRGSCLSLGSDFAKGNYGHFLLDCLSRVEIFRRAGGRLEEIDHFFLPKPPSRTARRIVETMGIPAVKCVWAEDSSWVCADVLIATSFPGLRRNYPDWLPASLQQYFPDRAAPAAKVYVPRTGVRKAINEAELIAIAGEFGFEVYDFEQCPEEPEFFSTVSAVVGAHGAGLTNLAFCKPGTQVLELIPSDHVHPYFYSLADSARLDYHCLMGKSQGSRPPDAFGPSPFDFHVDPVEFRSALDAMGSARAA